MRFDSEQTQCLMMSADKLALGLAVQDEPNIPRSNTFIIKVSHGNIGEEILLQSQAIL